MFHNLPAHFLGSPLVFFARTLGNIEVCYMFFALGHNFALQLYYCAMGRKQMTLA